MLIMCFPVYLDFGHGQLENEVAKVLFTTVFFLHTKGYSKHWLAILWQCQTNALHVFYHKPYSASLDQSWFRWTWAFKRASTTSFWAL